MDDIAIIPCYAKPICEELGTVRLSCGDVVHCSGIRGASVEPDTLSEISARLAQIQGCLSSLVVFLEYSSIAKKRPRIKT